MMEGAMVAIVTGIISAMLYDAIKVVSKIIMSRAIQMAATMQPSKKSLILKLMREVTVLLLLAWLLWVLPSGLDKSGVILVSFLVVMMMIQVLSVAWYSTRLVLLYRAAKPD
jgi:uncharacterized membrane protein YoaK (UPF0700 family)